METINARRFVIQGIFVAFSIILLYILFDMQVLDGTYAKKAQLNVVHEEVIYPSRGLIYDRDGRLIVNNEAVYDLMVIPTQIKSLDTNKLCHLLSIKKEDFDKAVKQMKKTKGYSRHQPNALFSQVPKDVYAKIQEYLFEFPGFYPQLRTVRHYPRRSAAHVLGYIGEVNQKQIDTSNYYKLRDYIGISGVEKTYEPILRGTKGVRAIEVDVLGRKIDRYKDGEEDIPAQAGQDLTITIDIELQEYAEKLMQNKRGSVVAIEPKTGEILTLVSSPSYDPNWLTGRERGQGMKYLTEDTLKPLYNRALKAEYPPGSTFKPMMGLLALQERVIHKNYHFGCSGAYYLGSLSVGCHGHQPAYTVGRAVQHSCNAYFCHIFKLFVESNKFNNVSEGLDKWKEYLNEFGLGKRMITDLPIDRSGFVPGSDYYDKIYKGWRWRASTIISLGIGQGELGVTPLQLAHSTAIIANRGRYYYPHVVRPHPKDTTSIFNRSQQMSIKKRHFEAIVDGMERVVTMGTARRSHIPGIAMCGKTGTAENPHGKDHSVFIGFGPKEDPKIAIAVLVENGGYGSTFAGPITSLMIEKYLTDSIATDKRKYLEKHVLEANLLK